MTIATTTLLVLIRRQQRPLSSLLSPRPITASIKKQHLIAISSLSAASMFSSYSNTVLLTAATKSRNNLCRYTDLARNMIFFQCLRKKETRSIISAIATTPPLFSKSSTPSFLSIAKSKLEQKSSALPSAITKNQYNPKTVQQSVDQKPKIKSKSSHQYIPLNKKISNAVNCKDIFNLVEYSLTKTAGGGDLNDVSFSTSVHRLARHMPPNGKERDEITNDKVFSLLFASLAEALVSEALYKKGNKKDLVISFGSRQLANIGWAIAKLGISTTFLEVPILQSTMDYDNKNNSNEINAPQVILASSLRLRTIIDCNGSQRQTELSVLTSQLLDYIGNLVLADIRDLEMNGNKHRGNKRRVNNIYGGHRGILTIQGYSNLLWAWATAGRANPEVFETVTQFMVQHGQLLLQSRSTDILKPQEWTNALWAVSNSKLWIRFFKQLYYKITHSCFRFLIISVMITTSWQQQIFLHVNIMWNSLNLLLR
jgi:hypothetical protein